MLWTPTRRRSLRCGFPKCPNHTVRPLCRPRSPLRRLAEPRVDPLPLEPVSSHGFGRANEYRPRRLPCHPRPCVRSPPHSRRQPAQPPVVISNSAPCLRRSIRCLRQHSAPVRAAVVVALETADIRAYSAPSAGIRDGCRSRSRFREWWYTDVSPCESCCAGEPPPGRVLVFLHRGPEVAQ